MRFSFGYDKKEVLQALRYHFIWQPEIKVLLILIILFDIVAAVLYYSNKIRPEPFLLGSAIWFFFMLSFWFLLPFSIYKKSLTFQQNFIIIFEKDNVILENPKGYVEWQWHQFTKYVESPNFFHLYFSPKSFFLVPKDNMRDEVRMALRKMLKSNIK